jgi:Transposase DDE domain
MDMNHTQQPLFLQEHHIVDLYCWIDDLVPRESVAITGRPRKVSNAEMVTVLIWNTIVLRQKTLKDLHRFVRMYHHKDFQVPKYSSFVEHCHQVTPTMFQLLALLLEDTAPVRLMDSTMLPVCKPHRADSYKVARGIAAFGKNWQGFHFGFKLHASIDPKGRLSQIAFTPANVYDAQAMPNILNEHCILACGDTLYGAKVMGARIKKEYGTTIIAPPFPKQNKKVAAGWQIEFLKLRSKIESVFDYLKEHLNLVSSFPRSLNGYVLHYGRILLGYQIMALMRG